MVLPEGRGFKNKSAINGGEQKAYHKQMNNIRHLGILLNPSTDAPMRGTTLPHLEHLHNQNTRMGKKTRLAYGPQTT